MPTIVEKSIADYTIEPADLPTVKYPDEVIARWDREVEIARAQIATGELVPQTVEELAAELGIELD